MKNRVFVKKKSQHLSQHLVNTCFPVSTLDSLTPIFVSQQLPFKADLCTNVKPQALRVTLACAVLTLTHAARTRAADTRARARPSSSSGAVVLET